MNQALEAEKNLPFFFAQSHEEVSLAAKRRKAMTISRAVE
jgi:hypothetical protein